ncbi:MAG: hypothetical protein A2X58_03855 [Nitrospirae bacterium GWC2_56_14]|nr:MAG: hypothetical protein A2X58_03855 [Nitrospirae bacterium GWC2_56_14]
MMRTRILSFIGWTLLSLWCRTLRITFVNKTVPDGLKAQGKNIIFAFWHGRQFLLFHTHRRLGVVIPASESKDGEIQAGILTRFGFEVVRGSSKRKGAQALLGLVDGLRRGKHIALAVDGPRGPLYEVKQGVTYLAGKLDKPIVPVITSAKRFWVLGRVWDKYLLPVPFTRAVVLYGEPIMVNGTSEDVLESKRGELQTALNRLMAEADEYFTKRSA